MRTPPRAAADSSTAIDADYIARQGQFLGHAPLSPAFDNVKLLNEHKFCFGESPLLMDGYHDGIAFLTNRLSAVDDLIPRFANNFEFLGDKRFVHQHGTLFSGFRNSNATGGSH